MNYNANYLNPPASTINEMAHHYMLACIWLSELDNGECMDSKYTPDHVTKASQAKVRQACLAFIRLAGIRDLEASGMDVNMLGHNLYLTAAGHGAGFWDRGLGELGWRLSDAARKSHHVESAYECGNNRNICIWIEGINHG